MNILDDMQDLFTNLTITYGRSEVARAINRSDGWVSALVKGNHVLSINQDLVDGLHRLGYDIALVKINKTEDGTRQYHQVKFKNSNREDKERYSDLV